MNEAVLVAGSAGFIGRAVAREIARQGRRVRIFDSLTEQAHAADAPWPAELQVLAECRRGDVRDCDAVRAALDGVNAVVHLAAEVGVGQSMYEIDRHIDRGAAVLLESFAARSVRRIGTASSMTTHGEELYSDADGASFDAVTRTPDAIRAPLGSGRRPQSPARPRADTGGAGASQSRYGRAGDIRGCYDDGKRAAETLAFDCDRHGRAALRVTRIVNTYGPRLGAADRRVCRT